MSERVDKGSSSILDRITALQGDITRVNVDAIVNAANTSLLGGGGVDGAIHRVAGPSLLDECRSLGGCPTGEARATGGYGLPAKWVFHTVGPVWHGGGRREPELLASCYRACLELARQHCATSIAFPSISTGAYGYPVESASRIAVREAVDFLGSSEVPASVLFVCFGRHDLDVYQAALRELAAAGLPSVPETSGIR
jgi:O-acetyl-ADP-ribose deacetylase